MHQYFTSRLEFHVAGVVINNFKLQARSPGEGKVERSYDPLLLDPCPPLVPKVTAMLTLCGVKVCFAHFQFPVLKYDPPPSEVWLRPWLSPVETEDSRPVAAVCARVERVKQQYPTLKNIVFVSLLHSLRVILPLFTKLWKCAVHYAMSASLSFQLTNAYVMSLRNKVTMFSPWIIYS